MKLDQDLFKNYIRNKNTIWQMANWPSNNIIIVVGSKAFIFIFSGDDVYSDNNSASSQPIYGPLSNQMAEQVVIRTTNTRCFSNRMVFTRLLVLFRVMESTQRPPAPVVAAPSWLLARSRRPETSSSLTTIPVTPRWTARRQAAAPWLVRTQCHRLPCCQWRRHALRVFPEVGTTMT